MKLTNPPPPDGFRWLKPHEHRKAGDLYALECPVATATHGWPINQDSILRPIKRRKS